MEKKKLVLGVIGADVHAVGNKILDHAFTAGFEVINLRVGLARGFIEAAIVTAADAIVVSSLYGRAGCRGLRDKCKRPASATSCYVEATSWWQAALEKWAAL